MQLYYEMLLLEPTTPQMQFPVLLQFNNIQKCYGLVLD